MPPAPGFVSLRWQPRGKRYWLEGYSYLVGLQDRLSSLELADQRIGAVRSRSSISRFFNNGAVARGLVGGGCSPRRRASSPPTSAAAISSASRVT